MNLIWNLKMDHSPYWRDRSWKINYTKWNKSTYRREATTDMIRTGEKNLSAQGVFEINSEQREELLHRFEIDAEDNEVIVRRTLDINGKGRFL